MPENTPVSDRTKTPLSSRRLTALGVVATILLAGAIGLNASATYLKLQFKKQPVELRQPIQAIAGEFGPWLQVSIDERFPAEIESELGTLDYVERRYVDTRQVDEALMAEWESADRSNPEAMLALRQRIERDAMAKNPYAVIRLHVAYYTGAVDTVPHIPDRCMLGGGFDMLGRNTVATLTAKPNPVPNGEPLPLDVSFAQFQQRTGGGGQLTTSVAYFFQVNGDYEHDAITGVRKRLQNLLETHAYFAKIEVGVMAGDSDAEPAKAALAEFLSDALPAIEKCLPDWEQVKAETAMKS